jgi:DNA-binding response OmpR family regulator
MLPKKNGAGAPMIIQPSDPSELLARVEALIRRVEKRNRTPAKSFSFDDVEIDFARAVCRAGSKISPAAKELQLLDIWRFTAIANCRAKSIRGPWMCT